MLFWRVARIDNLHVTYQSFSNSRKSRTWQIKRREHARPNFTPPFPIPNTNLEIRIHRTMRSILPLLSLSALLAPVQSLYFYIDGTTPKCFFEELPKDTLVVGHYTAEEWDDNRKAWLKHDGLNIFISVDVRPSSASVLPQPSTPFTLHNPLYHQHLSNKYNRKYSTTTIA
jgi:hypothetical protein